MHKNPILLRFLCLFAAIPSLLRNNSSGLKVVDPYEDDRNLANQSPEGTLENSPGFQRCRPRVRRISRNLSLEGRLSIPRPASPRSLSPLRTERCSLACHQSALIFSDNFQASASVSGNALSEDQLKRPG